MAQLTERVYDPRAARGLWSRLRHALKRLALGAGQSIEDERPLDPRLRQQLADQRSDAARAFALMLAGLVLATAAALWLILSGGTPRAEVALTFGFAIFGASLSRWWASRNAHPDEVRRLLSYGSIFYQEPETLRGLLADDVIDTYLRNLLRTVLSDGELGESLWTQAVSPLVHRLHRGAWRADQEYTVHLKRMDDELVVPVEGGELRLGGESYRVVDSELSYRRAFPLAPRHLWVGLIFDPAGGPPWFEHEEFCLREYTPLREEDVRLLCSAFPSPRVLEDAPSHLAWLLPARGRSSPDSPPFRERRLWLGKALARPSLAVNGVPLTADEVAMDMRGLAVRFPVPAHLRAEMRTRGMLAVHVTVAFPLARDVRAFPVHFPDPTRGAKVQFEFGDAGIDRVDTDTFFAIYKPFSDGRVERNGGTRVAISGPNEWVFPGSGLVFSWRSSAEAWPPGK